MTSDWKSRLPLARKADGTPFHVHFQEWECQILIQRYEQGGSLALQLVDEEGSIARATANLSNVNLAPGEILIKDYSENEGMLAALITAGVVTDTGRRIRSGHADIPVAKLAPEILEQWRQHQIKADGPSI